MFVYFVRNSISCATKFDDENDIQHVFTSVVAVNGQFDFESSNLIPHDKSKSKIHLLDSSDSVPALNVCGYWIGANHGHPCCVDVYSPNHNKTLKDVGAVYVDDNGTKFTILKIHNVDCLQVVSENIGKSELDYAFKRRIDGNLRYLSNGNDESDIKVVDQNDFVFLLRAIKMHYHDVIAYTNGVAKRIVSGSHSCDYIELVESYDIINPSTVAPALTASRPQGGYEIEPLLENFGKPMINLKNLYRVNPFGDVTVEFEMTKLLDVRMGGFMGVMYQELPDVYGGGVYRSLPKIKPFTTEEGTFDFSSPYPLRGEAFPQSFTPNREYRIIPDSPHDRTIDYYRDKDGNDKMAFVCGFLPVYDGEPARRNQLVNGDIWIYYTRKVYPWFVNSFEKSVKGVGYKKFFKPNDRSSVYSVPFENKKYVYFDLYKDSELCYEFTGNVEPLETFGITYTIENNKLIVKGEKGFATFIEE